MKVIELSTDQIERLKVLFPKIRSGVAQDRNARIEMVVLHNDIFGSNYRPDTTLNLLKINILTFQKSSILTSHINCILDMFQTTMQI